MATNFRQVMLQVIKILRGTFPRIGDKQIYLTPKIMLLPAMSPIEIQVAEGASQVLDHDGSVRREDFQIIVGLMVQYSFDSDGRWHNALSDLEESIWIHQETIADSLDGNKLDDYILRPLHLTARSAVEQLGKNTLVKQLVFIGGMNVEWNNTSI